MLVHSRTQCEQDTCGAARQIHRQPEQLFTREGKMALVVDAVPAKAPDLSSYLLVPDRMPRWVSPAEIEDHSGPAAEQTRLDVEPGQCGAANSSRSVDELVIDAVREVLVE
ncbi:MAG: hypothetical protein DLM62_17865, partial [Pseudonocardiales bacterium]